MVNQASGKTPAQKLLEQGENMRIENPVLWAIVRGRGAPARIGILSGQPKRLVEEALTRLTKSGMIYASERFASPVYMLNSKSSAYPGLKRLSLLYEKIELGWAEDSGIDLGKEKGLTSSSVFKQWREKHPEMVNSRGSTERFDDTLTMKQAAVLMAVGMAWADRSTFKPLELARAQGYSQGGYAKQSLLTLEGKGYVEQIGKVFRLTSLGVEKVSELQDAGVKPSRRDGGLEIDLNSL